MKDITGPLRKKYFELLNNNLLIDGNPVPVYNKYLPSVINTPYYVLIRNVSNTDISTKQSADTNTSLQIAIYTKDTTANPGNIADDIAGQIYSIIYPIPQSTIDMMPEFQVVILRLESDHSPDALVTDDAVFINRFITFNHKIEHRSIISP